MADDSVLKLMIVDDEPLARLWLRQLVQGCAQPRCEVVAEAEHGAQALALLAEGAPGAQADALLLDIAMPGIDGLHLAQELRRRARAPQVIFVTAHAGHALRAFELQALDYLTKPVQRERLREALLRVAQRRSAAPELVLVATERGRLVRIPASQVLYLKAELKYVTVRSAQGQWLLDESLNDLEKRLGPGFLRIHRNALVAIRSVLSLEPRAEPDAAAGADDAAMHWALQVSNGEWLAVSRRQVAAVREALKVS